MKKSAVGTGLVSAALLKDDSEILYCFEILDAVWRH